MIGLSCPRKPTPILPLAILASLILLVSVCSSAAEITVFYDFEGDYEDAAGRVLDDLEPTGGLSSKMLL